MRQQELISGIAPCLVSSESTEWYTPRDYVEAARTVMGSIDVDPASCETANRVVRAAIYYTKETNGFTKQWPGNVWMNPPYGYDDKKPNQARWTARLIEQYQAGIVKQAVALVNSKTGDKWFQPLFNYTICFPNHRINFYTPNGKQSGSTHSSALVYLGPDDTLFISIFRQFGRIVRAVDSLQEGTLWMTKGGRA